MDSIPLASNPPLSERMTLVAHRILVFASRQSPKSRLPPRLRVDFCRSIENLDETLSRLLILRLLRPLAGLMRRHIPSFEPLDHLFPDLRVIRHLLFVDALEIEFPFDLLRIMTADAVLIEQIEDLFLRT